MEKLLEEISFDAPARAGELYLVTAESIRDTLAPLLRDRDLTRYIL
jgi:ATP-dependent HslUV protease ATP-binding subunit HslU